MNEHKRTADAAHRVVSIAIFVIIQAFVLVSMFVLFRGYFAYYYIVCIAITVGVTMHIVRSDSNPEYKIAWIIPIMLLPIFGGLFYLVYGKRRPNRRERKRLELAQNMQDRLLSRLSNASGEIDYENPDAAIQSRYITANVGTPPFCNTRARYFPLGEDMFECMIQDLKNARHFIFMEYFIIAEGHMWQAVYDILAEKAAEGLDVRLIYDDIGNLFNLPEDFFKTVEARGIKCRVFNRFNNILSSRFNNRDHRKICVIDGNIGYTGGVNLADEYINEIKRFGHWKDSAVRLYGEGTASLTALFLSMWCFITGQDEDVSAFVPTEKVTASGYVQPYADTPLDEENVGENVYLNLISRAKKYVYITTPYLIISSEMLKALTLAAKSGVDVRIITPSIPDKKIVFALTRSYYEPLIKAGVRIFEYSPGFIHAKNFVSDNNTAVVGSINLDFRSLFLHFECAVWMYRAGAVLDVRDDFLNTQAVSREITLDWLPKPHGIKRFFLTVLRIFAPLM